MHWAPMRRRQHLAQDRRRTVVAREVGEPPGMVPMRHAGDDQLAEVVEQRGERLALGWEGRSGRRRRMSPGRTSGVTGSVADAAQVVGHPVHQLVAMAAEFFGVHRPKRTSCAGAVKEGPERTFPPVHERLPSLHRHTRCARRAGLDDSRPALLRRDERLHPARLAPSPLARDRGGAVPDRRGHRGRPGARRGVSLERDRPARHLASQHLRHHRGARRLLRPLLAERRPWATRPPSAPPRRSSSPCFRGRCWASGSAGGSGSRSRWRSPASSCCCGRRSPSAAPVAAVATAGAFFYALGHDLASADRSWREPRGGRAALLAGRLRHHDGAGDPVVDLARRAERGSTCSARVSAAAARSSR